MYNFRMVLNKERLRLKVNGCFEVNEKQQFSLCDLQMAPPSTRTNWTTGPSCTLCSRTTVRTTTPSRTPPLPGASRRRLWRPAWRRSSRGHSGKKNLSVQVPRLDLSYRIAFRWNGKSIWIRWLRLLRGRLPTEDDHTPSVTSISKTLLRTAMGLST